MSGGGIGDQVGHRERRHAARASIDQRVLPAGDELHAAAAGAENDTDAVLVVLVDLQTRVGQRFQTGDHPVLRVEVHVTQRLGVGQQWFRIPIPDFGGDRCFDAPVVGIEPLNPANPALTRDQVAPCRRHVIADGCDGSDAGNDDPARSRGRVRGHYLGIPSLLSG